MSYYDARDNGRESFTRSLYVARVGKGVSTAAIADYHQQIMDQLQSFHDAKLTGLLLIHPGCVLHLLEGSADILTSLFRHFNISSAAGMGMVFKYDEMRILMSSEDCPTRRLPTWSHFTMQASQDNSKEEILLEADQIQDDIFGVNNKLIDFGQLLVNGPPPTPGDAEDNSSQQIQHQQQLRRAMSHLPSNDCLLTYSSSKLLPSLEDYLNIYDCPIEIVLEEKIWSIESK